MKRQLWFLTVLATSAALAQEPAKPRADIAKGRVVERSTEVLVAELSVPVDQPAAASDAKPTAADRTKRQIIEPPAEEMVRGTQPPEVTVPDETPAAAADDNPRVEPGKVQWHADVAAAMAAAKISGKPVLVFHLMGQLDQRFT